MNIKDLKQIAQLLDRKLKPIQNELKKHGKLLKILKKDQETMLSMLDKEQMSQRKRLTKLEEHAGLPSIS